MTNNLSQNVEQMSDALDQLKSSGVLEQLPEEYQDKAQKVEEVLDEIQEDIKLIEDIKEKYGNNHSDQIHLKVCWLWLIMPNRHPILAWF